MHSCRMPRQFKDLLKPRPKEHPLMECSVDMSPNLETSSRDWTPIRRSVLQIETQYRGCNLYICCKDVKMYSNSMYSPTGTKGCFHDKCGMIALPNKTLKFTSRWRSVSALQQRTRQRSATQPLSRRSLAVSAVSTVVDRPAAFSGEQT